MYKILLVDDDAEVFFLIESYCKSMKNNYEILHLKSGNKIHEYLTNNAIDLILMDWRLENDEDGLEIIKDLKSKKAYCLIPMILLTAKTHINEQIQGLDEGADDYITKPFCFQLLISKINSYLRNKNQDKNAEENIKHLFTFNEDKLEIEYLGLSHKLTLKEFTILKILVNNPLKIHSQTELNELTSGKDIHVSKRCIDTFITILRKKIGKGCIVSVRKKGYKINENISVILIPKAEIDSIPY